MSGAGLELVRFFLFTPDFVKQGQVDPLQVAHFKTLLALLQEAHLFGLPTLFVGHMSGQNYRVAGWDEAGFFSDPQVLQQQQAFIRVILEAASESRQIAGWCLSNELPNDFPGRNANEVTEWFTRIIQYIRGIDKRPLTIGDGVWSPEITGHNAGNALEPSDNYHLRALAPLQDSLGVHFYPRYDDYWPQAYTAGFRLGMAASWKDAIFLEEYGNSTAMSSEENQALYYRGVLFSAWQAGATAALNWCWTDFDLPDLRPYLHNTFEMRFGLRRSDGSYRPALKELQTFSRLSKELSTAGWELAPRGDYYIIPANYYTALPFDWEQNPKEDYNLYLHTYGALASAGVVFECIHEPAVEYRTQDHENHYARTASFKQSPATMWLPALKRLSAPFWRQILDQVTEGSSLYASFSMDHWIIDLDETLGIESGLRFGLPEFYPDADLEIHSPCDWAGLGEKPFKLHLGELRTLRSISFLPAQIRSAEILLADTAGRPLLIRKQRGSGYLYFSLFPFEMLMLKSCAEEIREFVTTLYAGIRADNLIAGTSCETPAAEFLRFERGPERKEYLFNHAWEPRAFKLHLKSKANIIKNIRVELPPKSFCEVVGSTQDASRGLAPA